MTRVYQEKREGGAGEESERCGDDNIVICRSKVPSYCYLPYLAMGGAML